MCLKVLSSVLICPLRFPHNNMFVGLYLQLFVGGIMSYLRYLCLFVYSSVQLLPPRGCAGGRLGTMFLRPSGASPLKGANPAGTPGYRNGAESFFSLKGRPSVVRDV